MIKIKHNLGMNRDLLLAGSTSHVGNCRLYAELDHFVVDYIVAGHAKRFFQSKSLTRARISFTALINSRHGKELRSARAVRELRVMWADNVNRWVVVMGNLVMNNTLTGWHSGGTFYDKRAAYLAIYRYLNG